MAEIERKFFPKSIPNLTGLKKVTYVRYIIYRQNEIELRIQQVDGDYELERKMDNNKLSRETFKCPISKAEFELLAKLASKKVFRESYLLSQNPEVTLKIYHGDHEGLARIEAEFDTEDEAESFIPPSWYGVEITENPLGRDGKLTELSKEQFSMELNRIKLQNSN